MKVKGPKVLLLDIETAPIFASVWGIWDQTIPLNMIEKDWHLLSFAAKWLGDPESKVIYKDQRNAKNVEDDKELLKAVWKLLDECDILLTQNGKAFDNKKLNARFIINEIQPPSSFKHIDTKQIASRHFGFTSNKLEYLTDKLCVKYKKLKHKKYPGFELWKQCLSGNKDAWKEMQKYNIYDILSLEELYYKLMPWDNSINFNLYKEGNSNICNCGSNEFRKNGFFYSSTGRYQRYRCSKCGAELRDNKNEFSKEKKQSFRKFTKR